MKEPLVNNHFLIQKRESPSGFKFSDWTFVVLPDIPRYLRSTQGTIKIHGKIDHYTLQQYNLLPLKDNSMMLPLKAAIRKAIGKKEGDHVHVTLYTDDSSLIIPMIY